MNSDKIEVGDTVAVSFHSPLYIFCEKATVLYVPQTTGDSWIIKTESGAVSYISEGCTVTKRVK